VVFEVTSYASLGQFEGIAQMSEKTIRSVYVIKSTGGICKIGISFDPESRLRSLLTGHGIGLELVHVETADNDAARLIERAAHRMLEKTRSAGEWFKVPVEKAIQAVQIAAWIVEDCRKHITAPAAPKGAAKKADANHPKIDNRMRGPIGLVADRIESAWAGFPAGHISHAQIMDAIAQEGGDHIDQRTVSAWLRANNIPKLDTRARHNGCRESWYLKKGTLKLITS
jgi:hypothetical protein